MSLAYQLENLAQTLADLGYALLPRRRPSRRRLQECRIISHRGEHDNRQVRENTMAAFSQVVDAGVWGIELDLRWTRDLQPVVVHDPNARRVFGIDLDIAAVELAELQRQIPEIPTLAQVVERFAGDLHLMVELKGDRLDADAGKAQRLAEIFAPLKAVRDYHFLALETALFTPVAFAGNAACLLVAELNVRQFSQQALARDLGGLCGQYLLMHNRLLQRHQSGGQKIGTGFAASRFCFYRELNRGVDWVFTNHALKLAEIRRRLLQD